MEREYIRVKKPFPLPLSINKLKSLDDEFWKKWVFYHLLNFYQNYDSVRLKEKIKEEKKKQYPRIEREIAKFIRLELKANKEFGYHFTALGECTNDEDIEGNYDITILSTNWKSISFHFECKNLNNTQDLIDKYIYYNTYKKAADKSNIFDGGVYRYFNGKYAQELNFGGMIGFILDGEVLNLKRKILKGLKGKFDTTPNGDLLKIIDNSIENNKFTFDSYHNRFNSDFVLHHLLFNFH